MGTRGLYVFKYNGIYYIYRNNTDSHPNKLGKKIVDELNNLTNDNLNYIKELLSLIELRDEYEVYKDDQFEGLTISLKYYTHYMYKTSKNEPLNDVFFQYIYIIDLDTNYIRMKSNYSIWTFPLNNIPNNWEELFNLNTD